MATLAERLQDSDVINLPDWEAAEVLNTPDSNLPIAYLIPTQVGPGKIMEALGPTDGAALLDVLTTLSTSSSPIKWALKIIDRGDLDLSTDAARGQIDALVSSGLISSTNATKIKALANGPHQSWAQANNIEVTARTVGLARGGK